MNAIPTKLREIARTLHTVADAMDGLYRDAQYKDHLISRLCAEIDRQKADESLVRQIESFSREHERETQEIMGAPGTAKRAGLYD